MNHPMRRKDRQLGTEQTRAIMEKGEYGVLATCGEDGQPYAVPLNYVLLEDTIYFHCAKTGHKLDNICQNPKASFCVVGDTQPVYAGDFTTYFESAIAFGTVAAAEEEEKRREILFKLCEKYLPEFMDHAAEDIQKSIAFTGIYGLKMEEITGKAKPKKSN